MIAASTKY